MKNCFLKLKIYDKLTKIKKVVTSSVSWKSVSKNVWRLETRALTTTTKEILILKGYIGRDNYSFALLYNNIPIRKFTKHHKHTWNGVDYLKPHKHIWDEVTEDKEVYIPDDIDTSKDVSTQFIAFCNECNIEIKGGYQTFLFEETRP